MDVLANLSTGFGVALTFQNLFWCLMGAIIGTAIKYAPTESPAMMSFTRAGRAAMA